MVQNVVLMGAPLESGQRGVLEDMYDMKRHVVAGRFVNVFSKNDEILTALGKYQHLTRVAGLDGINGVPGIENIDMSDLVKSHFQYPIKTQTVLKLVFESW